MSKIRRILALATFTLVSSISLASRADAAVFVADGVFDDGSTLSGTVTIDTVAGLFTAINLVVGSPSSLAFGVNIDQGSFGAPFFYSVFVSNIAGTYDFNFGIPLNSIVGYTGGSLCSLETEPTCTTSTFKNLVTGDFGPDLVRGTLSQVPEPATTALAGSVLVGLWAIRRRV